jgi:hypothetical protein
MTWSRIIHMLRKSSSWRLCLIAGVILVGVIALVSFTAVSSAQIRPAAVQTGTTGTPEPGWGKHHHTPTPTPPEEHEETPTPTPTLPSPPPPPPAVPPTGSDPTAKPLP